MNLNPMMEHHTMENRTMSHHIESIKNMTKHYRENHEIKALFLIGSVATGTARPDSDIDGVAIISQEYHDHKKNNEGLEEVYYGKCTYEGGYFNIHYMTLEDLIKIDKSGSEPMRNMFSRAVTLFCDDPVYEELAKKIPVFQKQEATPKQFRFYCTLRMYYGYFWVNCKPEGFMRHHIADGMIYNLYRLILLENEILFPSMRKIEEYVRLAPNKPEGIIEKCHKFMQTLSDDDCKAIVDSYETWTSYDYPKDDNIIMNNFSDPWEWL
ncbi:MAG: nucleotidyltransferase domain-containing protein [Treponema sp.]|nr:nucleotidyltransferase domain-containing protein [Treponema sp.]